MAGPAFQKIGDTGDGLAPLGTAPLGTSPLGGGAYPIYELPSLQPGSDRLDQPGRIYQAKNTHEVNGMVVGERLYAEIYRWRFIWLSIPTETKDELVDIFRTRRFKLLPDADVPTNFWVVIYRGPADMYFPPKRGRIHDVDGELEQLTGPLAAV